VVNGILTQPSNIFGWTDFFEDYYQNDGFPCTKYEYFSGAITRFIKQGKRTEQLIEICKRSTNKLVYVGHSNGCELFSRVIKNSDLKFESAHLFAAAMNDDFNENGLNIALLSGRVGKVYLYCSKRDHILKKFASRTSFLKVIGLGYGALGYTGPKNVQSLVSHRVITEWRQFDHSDWFKEKNIKKSHESTYQGL